MRNTTIISLQGKTLPHPAKPHLTTPCHTWPRPIRVSFQSRFLLDREQVHLRTHAAHVVLGVADNFQEGRLEIRPKMFNRDRHLMFPSLVVGSDPGVFGETG